MIKAPFIRIWVEPKQGDTIDLTDKITNFVYDESMEIDNLVEFDIVANWVTILNDIEELDKGATIKFIFGNSGLNSSATHSAIITDVEHDFSNISVNMKIRALDKGSVLKKTSSSQVWENITSSEIAQLIADRHGLQNAVDFTDTKWEKMPQGNLDDLSFLRKLAAQETSGNFITYIEDNTLYFVRKGLNTASIITYNYGQGDNGIIKFSPRWRESTASPDSAGVTGVGFDPNNKEFNLSSETAESENQVISTEDYHLVYSADGEHLANGTENESFNIEDFVTKQTQNGQGVTAFGESGLSDVIKTGKQFVSPAKGQTLQNSVAADKKASTPKMLEAALTVVGNPTLKVNTLLTMKNVTKRYDGNWFIVACKHTISGSSYITEITLNRNGSKQPTQGKNTKQAESINKTQGEQGKVTDEVIILEFDANGNRTADITTSNNYVPPQAI